MTCYPMYQIDAFCKDLFSGNPAAVCILDEWLPNPILQAIASENNLSETAFLIKDKHTYHIRWFTPNREVELCGHATLAAAHVVFNHLDDNHPQLEFNSSSGPLKVLKQNELYTLDFPRLNYSAIKDLGLIEAILGFEVAEAYQSLYDCMVIVENPKQVENASPDLVRLASLAYRGLILSAHVSGSEIYSRCFYPKYGVNEDPMTGSAHCVLIPYWINKLGLSLIHAKQGLKRLGYLQGQVIEDRVFMSGHCKSFLEGHIFIEET